MTDFDNTSTLLQISLIARAVFFFIVFTFAGYLALVSNTQKLIAVRVLGVILIIVGLFNVVMAVEWFNFFY